MSLSEHIIELASVRPRGEHTLTSCCLGPRAGRDALEPMRPLGVLAESEITLPAAVVAI
jgi:hypothetical protein